MQEPCVEVSNVGDNFNLAGAGGCAVLNSWPSCRRDTMASNETWHKNKDSGLLTGIWYKPKKPLRKGMANGCLLSCLALYISYVNCSRDQFPKPFYKHLCCVFMCGLLKIVTFWRNKLEISWSYRFLGKGINSEWRSS